MIKSNIKSLISDKLFTYLFNLNNSMVLKKSFFPFGYGVTYNKEDLQVLEYENY